MSKTAWGWSVTTTPVQPNSVIMRKREYLNLLHELEEVFRVFALKRNDEIEAAKNDTATLNADLEEAFVARMVRYHGSDYEAYHRFRTRYPVKWWQKLIGKKETVNEDLPNYHSVVEYMEAEYPEIFAGERESFFTRFAGEEFHHFVSRKCGQAHRTYSYGEKFYNAFTERLFWITETLETVERGEDAEFAFPRDVYDAMMRNILWSGDGLPPLTSGWTW